jgi:threonine synthase
MDYSTCSHKFCQASHQAFQENLAEVPKIDGQDTLAEGIAIAEPIRGKQILEAVKRSEGALIIVDDLEIKRSLRHLCEKGFYIEPTSAATIAGLSKYLESSHPDEIIVSVFTGHGLKTTEKMVKLLNELSLTAESS